MLREPQPGVPGSFYIAPIGSVQPWTRLVWVEARNAAWLHRLLLTGLDWTRRRRMAGCAAWGERELLAPTSEFGAVLDADDRRRAAAARPVAALDFLDCISSRRELPFVPTTRARPCDTASFWQHVGFGILSRVP